MAYRAPGVTVTQEFANAQPSLATFALPNVIVGPIFQIVTRASSGTYVGATATLEWAGKLSGSLIDLRPADSGDLIGFPVKVELKDAVVELLTSSAGEVELADLNVLVDATSEVFAGVEAGDVVVVASGPLAGNYTVREKIDANTLRLNETFASASTDIGYSIRRNVGADGSLIVVESATLDPELGVTIPGGLTAGGLDIVHATVLLTYRALRLENSSDVKEYGTVAELQADFGLDQIVPENPAVFGAYLALSNSVTKTHLLGLKAEFLVDEPLAYLIAFDVLKLTDMYAITVLTQNTAVHTVLKAHVEGMSVPTKKLERVGIVNRRLVTTSVVSGEKTGATMDGTRKFLTKTGATFITDGVVPGHFVAGPAGRVKIVAVVSQTRLELAEAAPTDLEDAFVVERDLTKTEQARAMAAYARSLGSRRVVMTYPDVVKIPSGNLIRELPGFFLNCAVGALTTGLPTQQGLTNLSVALYTGVVHSTKYFDADQLNEIADGGVMIFVQEILDQTALFVRHQLTTDRSAIKFQEYSVTKNVDFIAKFIRANHERFIGQYNIVDSTFDDLKTNAKGIINFLTESTRLPKIGGVIRSGKLASIEQDPSNIDAIVERYELDIPIPLNNLDITIVV